MNKNFQCSIVIPAYNEQDMIEQTLSSLCKQSLPRSEYEIIVVDNGSSDRTIEIANKYADLTLSKLTGNVGSVRNYGIQHASADLIICTDADCLFDYDWIEKGISLLHEGPGSAYGGGLKTSVKSNWIEEKWLLNPEGKAAQQKSLMGSCIFIHKKDFNAIGGFLESVTSGEDSDLSERLERNGIRIKITEQLSVIHNGGPKTIKDFFWRQVWHSENYYKNVKKLITDKVFILTVIYTLSLTTAVLSVISGIIPGIIFSTVILVFTPALLTTKRVVRARYRPKSLKDLISIYALDQVYLLARSVGSIRGLIGVKSRERG